jgi:hypothetical protein
MLVMDVALIARGVSGWKTITETEQEEEEEKEEKGREKNTTATMMIMMRPDSSFTPRLWWFFLPSPLPTEFTVLRRKKY